MSTGGLVVFGLVVKAFYDVWSVQEAGVASQVACAARCSQHDACGGFQWNSSSCFLVVDSSVPGAVKGPMTNVFRLNSYKTNYILYELPPPPGGISPTVAFETCRNNSMDLVPNPVTPKDRASLSIRLTAGFYVDMIRASNGSYVTRSSGVVVPDTAIFGWLAGEPNGAGQQCMAIGGYLSLYFDCLCSYKDIYAGVICVYSALH
ncbi:uncharacterized protein LOC125179258 [Hyalella azteca]|uniref:Uncharacterized protein LOC125179258 n=1 Tax=Hyalella azteca TaxID=294128 RepID=A0A979FU51_HYAAZ|nr:uncharacterized protein LOC125179258 [Hyalella azteca]